jgi:UDP-glucose 4-epimerase
MPAVRCDLTHGLYPFGRPAFPGTIHESLVRGHRSIVKWGDLVGSDIAALGEAFRRDQPEAVLHFAVCAYDDESVERSKKYFHNNVGGSLHLNGELHNPESDPIPLVLKAAAGEIATYETLGDRLPHSRRYLRPGLRPRF